MDNDYVGMAHECYLMRESMWTYLRKFPRNYYPSEIAEFIQELNKFEEYCLNINWYGQPMV